MAPTNGTGEIEALVSAAQKGDEAAFRELIERTQDRLYRFLLYLTRQPALAEDLAQDTYLRAYEKLRTLREAGRFASWLMKLARNVFLAHVKLHKNSKLQLTADGAPDGDAAPSGDELAVDVQRALAALEADDRMVLLLVDQEGHSYVEAAEIMDATEAAVRARLHRARKQFRERFEKK